jgi:DNA-binding transcriptional regulator/RsmH inhibitor MraZ
MLVEYAEIVKNAVVVGCSDYAEIWAESNYERMVDDVDDEALRRALEACGL